MTGIICWVVYLRMVHIAYEKYVLSQYLVQPLTSNFVQSFNIFKYLDIPKDIYLAFNPEISELSDLLANNRKIKQTKKIYPDAVRYLPQNSPPL